MPKKWSAKKTLDVYIKTNGVCWYCWKNFDNDFTIDHVLPVSKGGTDDLNNLVPCCKSCNSGKRNKTIEEYRRAFQKSMGMIFTKKQIDWLKSKSITIPAPDKYYFWFEKDSEI